MTEVRVLLGAILVGTLIPCVGPLLSRLATAHVPGPSSSQDGAKPQDTPSVNGTDTPNGNIYFECSVCKRQVCFRSVLPKGRLTNHASDSDCIQPVCTSLEQLHGPGQLP